MGAEDRMCALGWHEKRVEGGYEPSPGLMEKVEALRAQATPRLDPAGRAAKGQYMTPAPVASFMASLFGDVAGKEVRLLDAGAGVGSLTVAFVDEMRRREGRPAALEVSAYEIEPLLLSYLRLSLGECSESCKLAGVPLSAQVIDQDFIQAMVELKQGGLFQSEGVMRPFTHAILNPPYRKLSSDSAARLQLRSVGIETSNLYTAFLALAVQSLKPGGELVAITPRSFCNGPYFKPFRDFFFSSMSLRRIHVFESRNQAFREDDVLQENIILHAIKEKTAKRVAISSSRDQSFSGETLHEVASSEVVSPEDPQKIIHIPASAMDEHVVRRLRALGHTLKELGLEVSTGPVVDFRLREYLLDGESPGAVPLIYPVHFEDHRVVWPKLDYKKPTAILDAGEAQRWLLPNGYFTVVRRLSSKEERRRIVAAIHDPAKVPGAKIAFENHLNFFHDNLHGLSPELARGLTVYLSSTLVDEYFRLYSGHTQVNAADLRQLPYPSREDLVVLGTSFRNGQFPTQREIDALLEGRIQRMGKIETQDPVKAQQKIEEALEILKMLEFPRAQQNVRSALTLLAILGLKPDTPWTQSETPLMGITPIMDFAKEHYGKTYAPNSRETFRRFTMHQFVEAGLAISNPDQLDRPVNSPNWCYQVEKNALSLLRKYGTASWDKALAKYRESLQALRTQFERERAMRKIPVQISENKEIHLSPGKHSELIGAVLKEFAPRFAPGAQVVYVGDTGDKWATSTSRCFKSSG